MRVRVICALRLLGCLSAGGTSAGPYIHRSGAAQRRPPSHDHAAARVTPTKGRPDAMTSWWLERRYGEATSGKGARHGRGHRLGVDVAGRLHRQGRQHDRSPLRLVAERVGRSSYGFTAGWAAGTRWTPWSWVRAVP